MRRLLLIVILLTTVACDGDSGGDAKPDVDDGIRTLAEPTDGPYVSMAVDYHFHDIHPKDHKEIAADRAFVVRNEGRNVHNVTIVGTTVSEDVKPGHSFRIDPVSKLGPPGTYEVVCKYHGYQGMRGEFTIVE